ncbi:MAG: flagellar biosynthetic protein FliR [Vulcanimicrobiaceae bacterium]
MTQLGALVFARCIGFVARAPGFSHPSVPIPLRAALAFVLALALVPTLRGNERFAGASFLAALLFELLVGAAIGFGASLLYEGAAAGGRVLDDYVGIQVANPTATAGSGQSFQQLWGLGFIAAFFVFNGYQFIVLALADSLKGIPPGALAIHGLGSFALGVPVLVMRAAVLVAGPALVLGLVANLGLGAVSRIIPRFNNFVLTFPVVFSVVLLATLVLLTPVLSQGAKPWLYLPFIPH